MTPCAFLPFMKFLQKVTKQQQQPQLLLAFVVVAVVVVVVGKSREAA